MGQTIAQKILAAHLRTGEMTVGNDIGIRIDQTLTQDATGTMAYLALERMGITQVRTERSVAYVDHNTLQCGFENADDHRYIASVAAKYGIVYSPAGSGICHQKHLEKFGRPGRTLIGSDSHTPTCGALGMIAIGAGGMDVAVAMAGGAYHISMPKMMKVVVKGRLPDKVTAKDLSLELLRRISVKGGVGYIIEWGGEGIDHLTVPQRATITNMGTETGATTSIFPSDEQTRIFLKAQGREEDYQPLASDPDAVYDKVIEIDASALEPMIACPHSPDNVKTVREVAGLPVSQVCIGSCTNSSLHDLMSAASLLRGRHIARGVDLSVSPGSRQVLEALVDSGCYKELVASGVRMLECSCGPCIGMGFSPASSGVSLRTFNRNFEGRSGTRDAQVYLCSPETAAASALMGCITDPRDIQSDPVQEMDAPPITGDLEWPLSPEEAADAEILRGPNIKPMPKWPATPDTLTGVATLKVGDNITTDHIMPAGAKILPYRSNIPKLSEFCFGVCDPDFPVNARKNASTIIVAGDNYGQGSSREHAALVPRYLGVVAIVCKSFARIHRANLVNAGILPLTLKNPEDYDRLKQGDQLTLQAVYDGIDHGDLTLLDETSGISVPVRCDLDERQKQILKAGGLMNFMEVSGN